MSIRNAISCLLFGATLTSHIANADTPIIIDNRSPGAGAEAGIWLEATTATDSFLIDSVYAKTGGAVDTFRFTPELEAGQYEVSAWKSCFSPRANDVRHRVHHSGGMTEVLVDQDAAPETCGRFVELGVICQ